MKYFIIAFFLATLFFTGSEIKACEIEFTIEGVEKENYKTGDENIIKIIVVYTHRVCPEGIASTKFKYDGIKIIGATKWEKIGNGKYERKLKLLVLEGGKKDLVLEAVRKCDKDGGYGKISLNRANPV